MAFELPDLPYDYEALAPYMSSQTLHLHHDKHHQTYVTNLNNLIKETEFEGKSLEEIVKGSHGKAPGVFNNAGQHWNHQLFWRTMKKDGGGAPGGELGKQIDDAFGSLDKFKEEFKNAALTQFGSGWAWLAVEGGTLKVAKTPNGENPLVHNMTPILGLDVWEHAYYLDYQNRRPDYVDAFLNNLVNWEEVEAELSKA
ncbi:MAG: superoxide dismutase [Pseudomonadota bacterium]